MAKEKQTRRMIAMALAAAVTMSSVPVVAFAEGGTDSGTTTTTNTTTNTTTSTETSGPDTTGSGTESDKQLTVTVTVNKKTDTTTETSTTTDNTTGDTVSTTENKSETTVAKTTTETDTSWNSASENKTVAFEGEKVETTVTETTTDTTTVDGVVTETTTEGPDTIREHETTNDTTTTVETTENGTTTTVENVQTENGTREDGTVVESEATNTKVTETDADGNVVEENYEITEQTKLTKTDADGNVVEEGYEKTEQTTVVDPGNGDQPDVKVELIPGTTTSQAVTSKTTTGDVPIFDWDTEYDYTVVEEVERTVTATTSEIKVTVNDSNAEGGLVGEQETTMKGLAPVYDYVQKVDAEGNPVFDNEGNPVYVKEDKGGMFDYQFNSGLNSKYAKNPENWDMPEGADVRFVGTGEHSKYYVATAYVEYEKDIDGNTVYDENGNPVIKEIRRYSDENSATLTIDGVPVTELPDDVDLVPAYDNYGGSRPFIFALKDKDGNAYYAYCCDLETGAADGKWYSVSNLEDSDYYGSEESADHIRSIVMNGYWGTSDMPNEDGSYNTGSLEKIKADMKAAIESGEMDNEEVQIPVKDADGNPVLNEDGTPATETVKMMDIIDRLTEGEALLATQAAIWSYANGSYDVLGGKDGSIVLDPDGYKWNHNPNGNSKAGEAMDDYGSAVVDFMYKWLVGLKTEDESTVVVNEKNFVEDMSLVVGDKAEGFEANQDDNVDNDVYNAALNFKLAFVPGENDDLLVQVTYTDMDGNEKNEVRRLAGENAEGQNYLDAEKDGDSYVIRGLQLSENEEFNFDLRLEGTQYLEQGVYVYAPVGGRDASQTFVGIAEGEKNVDVSMGVTVKFDVDENDRVVATRKWSKSSHNDDNGGSNDSDPDPTPEEIIEDPETPLAEEPELEDIGEEDVPLAAAPEEGMVLGAEDEVEDPMVLGAEDELIAATGDSNHAMGFGAMALAALAGMFGLRKKEN